MCYPSKVVKRRGFTALELIIVLVVGFSIIALSASKMGQLFSSSSTAAAMSSILDLYTAARSLRGPAGYGEGKDLLGPLVQAGMVPKALAIGEGEAGKKTLKNEWSGDITIQSTTTGMGFDLVYPNVPTEACVKMAQNMLNSGSFMAINIGAVSVKPGDPVATVVEQCALKKAVVMTFKFREGIDEEEGTS